jgi:beta-N-acetylhexosaminidase
VAVAAALLAGCSARSKATSPTVPSTEPSTIATSTSTSTSVPACSNASVVASWPVSRRAAQLIVAPVLTGDASTLDSAATGGTGGVLLLGSVPDSATLASRIAVAQRSASIRPFVMADEEGGAVQRLTPDVLAVPSARQMASTMTPSAVRSLASSLGAQMKRLGVDVDLAPVLDVDGGSGPSVSDPDGTRSFSASPQTAAAYGVAFMQGLDQSGVLAVVKHFPGLGDSSGNTDFGPASTQPISTLDATGLVPFRAALGAGVKAVLVANASVPGLSSGPASLSGAVVSGLLRRQLHFGGLVMTDSLSAGAISAAGYTVPSAAVAAIRAGEDMVLFGSTLTPADLAALAPEQVKATTKAIESALEAAVTGGSLPVARLDAAVTDVLAAKGVNLCS